MSPEGFGSPGWPGLSQGAKITVPLPLHAETPLHPDRVSLLAHPPLSATPCSPESHLPGLKRVVDVKGGILRAGSVLDHSWVLWAESRGSAGTWCPWGDGGGASPNGLWLRGLHVGGHAGAPTFAPNPSPHCLHPPGCSLVWSHRHPHVAALPRHKRREREYNKRARPGARGVGRATQNRPARHLKGVVKLARAGEGVSAVSALSHVCNCGLGRPCPARPCAAAAAAPSAPSAPVGQPARPCTDWPRRPEGSRGSPQRRPAAPAPPLRARTEATHVMSAAPPPPRAAPPGYELQVPAALASEGGPAKRPEPLEAEHGLPHPESLRTRRPRALLRLSTRTGAPALAQKDAPATATLPRYTGRAPGGRGRGESGGRHPLRPHTRKGTGADLLVPPAQRPRPRTPGVGVGLKHVILFHKDCTKFLIKHGQMPHGQLVLPRPGQRRGGR